MNRDLYGKLIFELSQPGRRGMRVAARARTAPRPIPSGLLRKESPQLPEVDEPTVARHYNNLSTNNYGVDTGFYPLGSCTMKYNPKLNEEVAASRDFAGLHPLQPALTVQGALAAYHDLQKALAEICGMAEFTLNPYAGAHGELTGLLVIRAYHASRGEGDRSTVLVPDSAHGTNPASAAMAGYKVVEIKSLPDGTVDTDDLRTKLNPSVAALMMTNPNTLGIFEPAIPQIAREVHAAGALLYYDGANLNPLLGVARPGDMGFDVMHVNLHKTFSTPHGGGGPGSGPVGVRAGLEQFLPTPRVATAADGTLALLADAPQSLGSVTATLGNFAVELRALAYILSLGRDGLANVGPLATLNANYVSHRLRDLYKLPIRGCASTRRCLTDWPTSLPESPRSIWPNVSSTSASTPPPSTSRSSSTRA